MPRAYIDIGVNSFGPLADFVKQDVVDAFKGVGDEAAQAELAKPPAKPRRRSPISPPISKACARRRRKTSRWARTCSRRCSTPPSASTRRWTSSRPSAAPTSSATRTRSPKPARPTRRARSIQECVAKEEAYKPEGGDFVGYAKKQLVDLKQFIVDHNVVSIPGTEEREVKQSPPYNAQNGAYIDIPGPYEKNMPSYYNIAAPDPKWSQGEAARLHPRQGQPAVHLGARSLARPLPAVPARQPLGVDLRPASMSATPSPKAGRTTPRR